MRLLNVHTFDFKEFPDGERPPYVITSHRWKGGDEAMLDDIVTRRNTETSGYKKVEGFAKYTRENLPSIDWLWIDTCCIKQDNAVELQRSINSMFRWYLEAEVCIAYLSDVFSAGNARAFEDSVWFKRGWTLQELLASRFLIFVSDEWDVIGHKGVQPDGWNSAIEIGPSLETQISTITNIGAGIIHDFKPLEGYSVEEALAWMEKRETYLHEDKSYSLFGIFKVNTWLNYGEGGEDARSRLLAEITNSSMTFHSVPLSSVENYTDRCALSEELAIKLQNPISNKNLAHGATVVGLGGTGKTQLVLNYIESHKRDYNAILWLDAQSKDVLLSSFQRCCHKFHLTVNAAGDKYGTLLRDQPHAHAVLQWLESRSMNQPWLVVIDNADDLETGVRDIVPRGEAGSVIITSQDHHVSLLLGGSKARVEVQEMMKNEATDLLLASLGEDAPLESAKEIVDRLGRLPFAIHLAATRIKVDVEDDGSPVGQAMLRYLSDFDRHRQSLLNDAALVHSTAYGRTVMTAWNTTLLSVKEISEKSGCFAYNFLIFLTMFDTAHIQEDLFRLASQNLEQCCSLMRCDVLPWVRKILSIDSDSKWDDFHYRAAVHLLVRYGLIRKIEGDEKGLTMHSLVRWRASHDGRWGNFQRSYILLILSAMLGPRVVFEHIIGAHLPNTQEIIECRHISDIAGRCMAWSIFGNFLIAENRYDDGIRVLLTEYAHAETHFGRSGWGTMSSRIALATGYNRARDFGHADELIITNLQLYNDLDPEDWAWFKSVLQEVAYFHSDRSTQNAGRIEGLLSQLHSKLELIGGSDANTLLLKVMLEETTWQLTSPEKQLQEMLASASDRQTQWEVMEQLAKMYRTEGRWEELEKFNQQMCAFCLQHYGPESREYVNQQQEFLPILIWSKKWREAQAMYCASAKTRERHKARCKSFDSPLCAASTLGDSSTVQMLLALRVDKCLTHQEISCALSCATIMGHLDVVRLLFDHVGHLSLLTEANGDRLDAIALAVHAGNTDIVQFLSQCGAPVNIPYGKKDTYLLHVASLKRDSATVRILLAAGADPSIASDSGWTPLQSACLNDDLETLHILIKAGADTETRLEDGDTPLLSASKLGRTSIVQALLDVDADFTAKDKRGWAPLRCASYCHHIDIVRILLKKEVDAHGKKSAALRLTLYQNPLELLDILRNTNSIIVNIDDLASEVLHGDPAITFSIRNGRGMDVVKFPRVWERILGRRRYFGTTPLDRIMPIYSVAYMSIETGIWRNVTRSVNLKPLNLSADETDNEADVD